MASSWICYSENALSGTVAGSAAGYNAGAPRGAKRGFGHEIGWLLKITIYFQNHTMNSQQAP